MKLPKVSRRTWLRGACGVALALPLLDVMQASAQVGSAPRRLIVVFSPNGWNVNAYPTSKTLLGTSLEPLQPFMDAGKLVVTRGLSFESAKSGPQGDQSHYLGWAHMLTAADAIAEGNEHPAGGHASLDQVVAQRIGSATKLSSSLHGVYADHALSWSAPNQPLKSDNDPASVFARLFADFTLGEDALAALRDRRLSVLDYAKGSTEALKCKLGSADRQKLDAHLESIREIEKQVSKLGTACAPPVPPPEGLVDLSLVDERYPMLSRLQIDLMVQALACDLTRVATLQYTRAVGGGSCKWIDGVDYNLGHHELSHKSSDAEQAQVKKINHWYASELAYLLGKLDALPEGEGTVLDNSVVLWVSEIGVSVNAHELFDQGFIIGGGAGGRLAGGQYLQYSARPHNDLLLELANLVLPADQALTSFGNPALSSGGLAELRA